MCVCVSGCVYVWVCVRVFQEEGGVRVRNHKILIKDGNPASGKSSLRKLKATRMWMARMYEGGLSITFAISVLAGSCESSGILFCRVC